MSESAKIAVVASRNIGTNLTSDHPSGSTQLAVSDRSDFDEGGGTLTIDGSTYTYTPWEGEAEDESLTLLSPTTADHEDGQRVLVYPLATETVATVVIGETGEGIEIDIPHHLVGLLAEGTRDIEHAETVEIEESSHGWQLANVTSAVPAQNAAYLVGTVPDAVLDDTQLQADLLAAEAAITAASANSQQALNDSARAIIDAAAAQAEAEGRAFIVRSTDNAPVGPDPAHKNGDIWRKVDVGTVLAEWQHDGATWVPQTVAGTMLSADAIDGKTITGAKVQTSSAASRGVKMLDTGIIGYDSAGNVKTTINATTGVITAVDGNFTGIVKATAGEVTGFLDMVGSGVIRTAASGQRVQMSTSGITAHNDLGAVTAVVSAGTGGLDLAGDLRVLANGSGVVLKSTPGVGGTGGEISVLRTGAEVGRIYVNSSGSGFTIRGPGGLINLYSNGITLSPGAGNSVYVTGASLFLGAVPSDPWHAVPKNYVDDRRKAGVTNATTNATGYVTVTHGGTSTPKSIQLSGRNAGHYPYLTALDPTTFTVRFLLRSTGAALAAATSVSFDWGCDFA